MMKRSDPPNSGPAATSHDVTAATLRAEAQTWLRRLHGGEATTADTAALAQWRAISAAHNKAFAEASLLWTVLGDAARHAERAHQASAKLLRPNFAQSRRGFLIGGGAALAASAAGVMVVRPPLGLWPSATELAADYRTGTGERRQIEVAQQIAVELNTRTSLDLRPASAAGVSFELLSGEAAVANRPGQAANVTVIAGAGASIASNASFNIRKTGSDVRVSCIDGRVDVQCHDRRFALTAGQQIAYGANGNGDVTSADPELVTAWRQGMLMFRRTALADVIDEVNRYRSGRMMLVDSKLAARQVMANFRLDRIDDVIDFIAKAMNLRVRSLPGGVVLVG